MRCAGLLALTGVDMEVRIEPYNADNLDAVIQLSLRAWTPVFESIQNAMDVEVYRSFYPNGWRMSQQKALPLAQLCCSRRSALPKTPMSGLLSMQVLLWALSL
ncbi:hypothetical protein ACKFKF_16295 [Phormidesmis sp. 146-12]